MNCYLLMLIDTDLKELKFFFRHCTNFFLAERHFIENLLKFDQLQLFKFEKGYIDTQKRNEQEEILSEQIFVVLLKLFKFSVMFFDCMIRFLNKNPFFLTEDELIPFTKLLRNKLNSLIEHFEDWPPPKKLVGFVKNLEKRYFNFYEDLVIKGKDLSQKTPVQQDMNFLNDMLKGVKLFQGIFKE